MPKLVDHDKRKNQIAEAVWRVIVEEGLENATVRKIASEAGLSPGSLRHYFPSHSELLQYSMELVSRRVHERIEGKTYNGPPLEAVMEIICEMLPVDEERRIEMEVWFVFSAKTLVDANLKTLSEQVYREMHEGMTRIIHSLESLGLVKKEFDRDAETDRLHTLVDGMAMHHLLHPRLFTYEKMIHTLKAHLLSLCRN